MKWTTVKAQHVSQACDTLLESTPLGVKPSGLIVVHKGNQIPAKAVLRLAYCLANDLPAETKLKFAALFALLTRSPKSPLTTLEISRPTIQYADNALRT